MLYHISQTAGIRVLQPRVSSHQKAYVYAIENLITGLLFGAPHDDLDFIIDEQNGTPIIMECYPDAFRSRFEGIACSVYEVPEAGFLRGMTTWQAELVNENAVPVLREIAVPDLYSRLLQEEAAGRLIVRRYQNTMEYKHIVSEHIVDRLIRFDLLSSKDARIQKYYGGLVRALQEAMDGHLL